MSYPYLLEQVYYSLSQNLLHDYLSNFSLEALTFIHLWRIIAAALFLHYGAEGLLPKTFVNLAGYGDLVAGLMVPDCLIASENIKHHFGYLILLDLQIF